MSNIVHYPANAELPSLLIEMTDDAGAVLDLTGLTCTLTVATSPTATALLTKSGTGSAAGMTVTFASGNLNLPTGQYLATAQARNGSGLDYVRRFTLVID